MFNVFTYTFKIKHTDSTIYNVYIKDRYNDAFSLTVPDKESLRLIPYSGFGRGRLNCRYAKRIGVALYRRCGV
jgi:hypothetical protein